jgi:hypothetical protein
MENYFVKDTIKLESLRDVLKLFIKVKAKSKGYNLSEAYLNLIVDFHFYGFSKDTYEKHLTKSLTDKTYFKSEATIDNSKSYLKKIGIIEKDNYVISSEYLPALKETDKFHLTLKLYHD